MFVGLISLAVLHAHLQRSFWIGAGLTFAGVALIAVGAGGGLGSGWKGILLAIALALTWASYTVAIAPLMRRYSPFRISAVVLALGWVPLALVSIPQLARQDFAFSGTVWLGFAYAVIGPLFLTNILWFTAVDRVGAPRAAIFNNLQPFFGVLFALLILSESLHGLEIVGGVLIFVGHRVRAGVATGAGERADRRVSRPAVVAVERHNRCMAEDFMPLLGWDHVEFWVGNAKQAAYFYEHAMGFTRTAYAGPETGVRDRASYVLEQGDIRFVVTTALREEHEITKHHAQHGDGVRDIALTVPDATEAYRAGRAARRAQRRRAAARRGRVRPRRARGDRDVRRHDPHVRQPRRLRGPVPAGLRLASRRTATPATASGSRTSTTSSATSSSARWTTGSSSTSASSG